MDMNTEFLTCRYVSKGKNHYYSQCGNKIYSRRNKASSTKNLTLLLALLKWRH